MTQRGTISLRVELEGELVEQFYAVKRGLGLKLKSEVVRALIRYAYLRRVPPIEMEKASGVPGR